MRVGRGASQRLALYNGILIKENHIAAAGGIAAAFHAVRALHTGAPVQTEVEALYQLKEALDGGAVSMLFGNFSPSLMRIAVGQATGRARLEVFGGISLATLRRSPKPVWTVSLSAV